MTSKTGHVSIKEIAKKYSNRVWNAKDIAIIDELVDQEILIHSLFGDFHGKEAMKEVVRNWLRGFPNLRVDPDFVIVENDLVSIQWHAQGTHQGEFKGRKPTGKSVSYSGMTIYRIKNGKITEYWAYLDMQFLLNQIE